MKLTLSAPIQLVAAAPEDAATPTRTIQGLAVPWNVDANASTGPVRFLPGSLPVDGPAPKLIRDHDRLRPIGIVSERVADESGMMFSARISETPAGDEALTLALDGVLDSVSVGVEVLEHSYEEGTLVVASGRWMELSLVPWGAFDTAKISDVAAQIDAELQEELADETPDELAELDPEQKEEPMNEQTELADAPAPLQLERKLPTAGSWIHASLRGEPLPRVHAATGDLADVPGVVPMPLVGEVWNSLAPDLRPIFSALGASAMPIGDPFYARKITQHTQIGTQAAEHDTLASRAMTVSRIQCDKVTLGGYLDLSEQEIINSTPEVLGLVVSDMAAQYAIASEQWVGDSILFGNAGTATATISDWTDGDEVVTDLAAAAAEIRTATGRMPSTLIVKSTVWASLVAAKDSGGNRTFPYLAPSNASGTMDGLRNMGGNPLGLRLIVSDDWDLTAGTASAMILTDACVRLFEDARGALRVEQPATLSTRLALRGYVAAADYDIAGGCLLV